MKPSKDKLIDTLLNKRELWNRYAILCVNKRILIDFYCANLDGANLKGANLERANLAGAYLKGANLDGANLDFHQLSDYQKSIFNICPTGQFEGYKKIIYDKGDLIIKIRIPAEAKRFNALSSRKCRAEYAIFDSIVEGDQYVKVGYSKHDSSFKYILEKGTKIIPDSFDERNIECSNGVHFFLTLEEAKEY